MTLALALIVEGAIIVAADGRAYTTDQRGMSATQEAVQKIIELEPGKVMLVSGLAELVTGAGGMPTLETTTTASGTAAVTRKTDPNPDSNLDLVPPGSPGRFQKSAKASAPVATLQRWADYLSVKAALNYRELFPGGLAQPHSLRSNLSVVVAGYTGEEGANYLGYCSPDPYPGAPVFSEASGTRGNRPGSTPVLLNFNSVTNFRVNQVHEPFVAIGAMGLAHYLLRRFYNPQMDIKNGVGLAYYCLKEACFHYPLLGGQLSVGFVRPSQPLQWLEQADLVALDKAATSFIQLQKEMLQKGLGCNEIEQGYLSIQKEQPSVKAEKGY